MSAIGISHRLGTDDGRQWLTLTGRKNVLVVVHTVTYAKRLLDVFSLLGTDFRIQVVCTAPPHAFSAGVAAFLERLGCALVPWRHAVRMRFDLALAAGPRGLERLDAPLVLLPHGANFVKRVVGAPELQVFGLRRQDLLVGGRMPAAVVLPHHDDLAALRRSCPEAAEVATVAGDPVRDRIVASLPDREGFRRALGVGTDRKLLAITSTWGPYSSFARFELLLPWLLSELRGAAYRAVVLVHPNVYSGHGPWQVRSWLGQCVRNGVGVLPPESDWRSVLIASDTVVGDAGSVTLYGTLTRAPILLATAPEEAINPDSPAADLVHTAPALTPSHPLLDQLRYAREEYDAQAYARIAGRLSSEPGRFHRNIRAVMYRLLGLGQPAHPPRTEPLPPPVPAELGTGPLRDLGESA